MKIEEDDERRPDGESESDYETNEEQDDHVNKNGEEDHADEGRDEYHRDPKAKESDPSQSVTAPDDQGDDKNAPENDENDHDGSNNTGV